MLQSFFAMSSFQNCAIALLEKNIPNYVFKVPSIFYIWFAPKGNQIGYMHY